jgi:hypothetical protein
VKALLVVHTTCGVEFELVEEGTGKVIVPREYICEEDDEEAEDAAKQAVARYCEKRGHDLVGEIWS